MTTLNKIKKIIPTADDAAITSLVLTAMQHSKPRP
jgi:hypothetical protein